MGSVGPFDPDPGSAVVGSFVVGSVVDSFLFLSCVFVVVDLGISFVDFRGDCLISPFQILFHGCVLW